MIWTLTFSAIFRHIPRSTRSRAQRWTRGAAAGPGETRQPRCTRKPQKPSLPPIPQAPPSAARLTRGNLPPTQRPRRLDGNSHPTPLPENAVFQPATRRGQANTRARGRSDRRSSRTRPHAPAHARARRARTPTLSTTETAIPLRACRLGTPPRAPARRPGSPRRGADRERKAGFALSVMDFAETGCPSAPVLPASR